MDVMGLFASRPEEPFEWAGLPSEPADALSDAERLVEPAGVDPAGLAGSGFGSIVIPAAPAASTDDDSAGSSDSS